MKHDKKMIYAFAEQQRCSALVFDGDEVRTEVIHDVLTKICAKQGEHSRVFIFLSAHAIRDESTGTVTRICVPCRRSVTRIYAPRRRSATRICAPRRMAERTGSHG